MTTAALEKDRPENFHSGYCINFSSNHTTKEKQRSLLGMAIQTETQDKRAAEFKKKKFSKFLYKLVNKVYIMSQALT